MKKFLIFLVSIVVVVCLGLTTYYFMRNNEIISIKTNEIYCNVGDTIPLNSLGIEIKKANKSKKTVFNYNAGGEDVTKFIAYNDDLKSYVVSQENAGDVTLVISTTNKKYNDFTINVHIGNGSVEHPYFIFNETDLNKIGTTYRLDKHYVLMNDITLTSNFKPIGFNANTSTWDGFSGSFNGNGYTINALNVNGDFENAGLFSSINQTATVKNLTVANATISGSYVKAGAIAGEVLGNLDKVAIKNVAITNTKDANYTGAMAGVVSGNVVMSYVDGATINLGEEANATTATVGGMFGKVETANVQATYVNNTTINATNATLISGGFAGEFVIDTNAGSIQQSYANVSSTVGDYAAFIGKITTANTFDASATTLLKYLIGNIAVVYGKDATANIVDADLIKVYDNTFFTNVSYPTNSVFFDTQASLYMVRGYASAGEVITKNEFIYYAVNSVITTWDLTYVWNTTNNALPTLRMGEVYPVSPSNEYFLRDLTELDLNDKATFVDLFKADVDSQKINITNDVDVTDGWTPVSVKNSIIDGNNKTIRINLNTASNDCLGLFTTVDNSTIRNLNIVVTGVSANANNAGALAGIITSTDAMTTATIENITITYEGFNNPIITNFGGLAGSAEKATITNIKVSGLSINADAQIENAGGIVAINNATIQNSEVNVTVYAKNNVGGVVAKNNLTISNITGTANVNYNKNYANAYVGGVVGYNSKTVSDVELTVNINADTTALCLIGGVAGTNAGNIDNVTLYGDNIQVSANVTEALIGGVVAANSGTITNVNNAIKNIGTYTNGKNQHVAGVVATNNGTITNVLTQSNVYGNTVAGVVVTNNGTINGVAVGVYNKEEKSFTANEISADKYIAGIVVDFKKGNILNVQTTSKLIGKTNSTRTSLVVLLFPNGANLKNSTINNSFEGHGKVYREVWTDFTTYSNKAEFGYTAGSTGDSRFDIYEDDSMHGSMQSVVINTANAGVKDAEASMTKAVWFFGYQSSYNNTSNSSYVKYVDGFSDFSQFRGNFEFTFAVSDAGHEMKTTKELTFNIGDIWESNNGISLIFLNNIA